MRVISVAYFALLRPEFASFVRAGGDAARASFEPLDDKLLRRLAFDHGVIVRRALARIRADLDRTPMAFALVSEPFRIAELRAVFEVVRGEPIDPGNFRKRVQRMIDDGTLEQVPGRRITGGKPAQVFRFVRK
jgi:8-oxo-dGTP diphosphatase